MATQVIDRQIINGLRLAAKLMTNAHLQLSPTDQATQLPYFNLHRDAINTEITQREGTPYTDMVIAE